MQLTGLLQLLRDSAAYRTLLETLTHQRPESLRVIRSARPFVLAALAQDWPAPVIYLTARVDRAYNVSEQLPVWLSDRPIHRFAEPAPLFYDRAPWGDSAIRGRIAALSALMDDHAEGAAPLIVSSARAMMQRTLPVNMFRKNALSLKVGQRQPIDPLLQHLVRLGYEPSTMVVQPGQFSRRGGLVDIFPIVMAYPVRIEYFDDEIESLRHFDPASQRSTDRLDQLTIPPARESLPEHTPPLATHLQSWFESLPDNDPTNAKADFQHLSNGVSFPYSEHYIPYLYHNPVSLLDYAPEDSLIVVEDWEDLRQTCAQIEEDALKNRAEKLAAQQIHEDHPLPYLTWDALVEELESRHSVEMGSTLLSPLDATHTGLQGIFAPEQRFGGQLKPMLDSLRDMRRETGRVVVVSGQAPRLTELWREQSTYIPLLQTVTETPQAGDVAFVNGALQEGWRLHSEQGTLHLLTDAEIFGWNRPEPRRRQTAVSRPRVPESNYADLKEGDFVVHVDYGIGRFAGMRHRTIDGNQREYLLVEYDGTDLLFVPVHQADRLTRYVGADDRAPSLNRLGKPDWQKLRTQVKKAVEEEAEELLALYTKRAQVAGHAFGPDTTWQHELEASFPFVETEDQLRALREVKQDMEQPYPMDRLICGDVGYGKTEVALRAAFKAVMDGKQVAVLVPTTVLAQQHYETFSLRLAPFPIKVEVLSRFRSKEEQSRLMPKIASGEIDIIIGTHRLLSKDITLRSLGLVIIDEEQRFGVTHKEHFKTLRTQVDVLTLTATPIPRTLYMSLTGVRDISMVQTPPEERLPIITHVGPYDERLLRQAALHELERGGQLFYVHNRVQSIEAAQERLERIVPELRTVIAHGQMPERHLEKVMAAFDRGEYDALISTSIIENGINIPNANTLIVDRADWFGLSQLYQLRGRVGRSALQGYAYLFHAGDGRLTDEAQIRLETMAENNNLGAGYQIAMRDLELRGAGDILSTRQTGHVAAIGLHLYTQMLSDSISRLKGDEQAAHLGLTEQENIAIDLPLPAYLPSAWIPEMSLRLQIYRRIAGLHSTDELSLMHEELEDRFGTLPPAVENLLYQIQIKLLAQRAGASAITAPGKSVHIKLPYLPTINRDALQDMLGVDVSVTRTAVEIPRGAETEQWQQRLLTILRQLSAAYERATDISSGK